MSHLFFHFKFWNQMSTLFWIKSVLVPCRIELKIFPHLFIATEKKKTICLNLKTIFSEHTFERTVWCERFSTTNVKTSFTEYIKMYDRYCVAMILFLCSASFGCVSVRARLYSLVAFDFACISCFVYRANSKPKTRLSVNVSEVHTVETSVRRWASYCAFKWPQRNIFS